MQAKCMIVAIFMAFFSTLAMAGYTQPAPVDVTVHDDGSGSGFAGGDMVSARFSDGDTVFIGCGMRIFDDGFGGHFEYGFCQAEDADGERGFCATQNPEIVEAMKHSSDYSYLLFEWNDDGECIYVGSSTQSFYLPELTDKVKKDKGK